MISLIPYAWLMDTHWQAPQGWTAYAKDAIRLGSAFISAGTIFGLLAGPAWFTRQGGFDSGGVLWKRIVRFVEGVIGVLILYLGSLVLFGLIVPDADALLPDILRYLRYFLVGAWISPGAPWVYAHLNLAGKAA